MLPENTLWTVTEYLEPIYSLQDIDSTTDGSAVITELPVGGGTGTTTAAGNRTMQIDLAKEDPFYTITFDWGDGEPTVKKVPRGQKVMFPDIREPMSGSREYKVVGWGLRKGSYDKPIGDYPAGRVQYGLTADESGPYCLTPTSDMTLYAIREYEVRYEGDENPTEIFYSTSTDSKVTYTINRGRPVQDDQNETLINSNEKIFEGWKDKGSGEVYQPNDQIVIDWKTDFADQHPGKALEAVWSGKTYFTIRCVYMVNTSSWGDLLSYMPRGEEDISILQEIGSSPSIISLLGNDKTREWGGKQWLIWSQKKSNKNITITGNVEQDKTEITYVNRCTHYDNVSQGSGGIFSEDKRQCWRAHAGRGADDDCDGVIGFEPLDHEMKDGKCKYCEWRQSNGYRD